MPGENMEMLLGLLADRAEKFPLMYEAAGAILALKVKGADRLIPIGNGSGTELVIAATAKGDGEKGISSFLCSSRFLIEKLLPLLSNKDDAEDTTAPITEETATIAEASEAITEEPALDQTKIKRNRNKIAKATDRRDEWVMHYVGLHSDVATNFTRGEIISEMATAVEDGSCPYPGAVSSGALDHVFKLMIEEHGIIEVVDESKPQKLTLTAKWKQSVADQPVGTPYFNVASILFGNNSLISDFLSPTAVVVDDEDMIREEVDDRFAQEISVVGGKSW